MNADKINTTKCPFFVSTAIKSITCKGIAEKYDIKLLFTSGQKRDMHKNIFCDSRYNYCELYSMLEKGKNCRGTVEIKDNYMPG